MIDYGKVRRTNKIDDNHIEHITEVYFDSKLIRTTVDIEEHRKTSIQTILSDLVDAASIAKDSPITIEIRHDHANYPKLLVLHYRKLS